MLGMVLNGVCNEEPRIFPMYFVDSILGCNAEMVCAMRNPEK